MSDAQVATGQRPGRHRSMIIIAGAVIAAAAVAVTVLLAVGGHHTTVPGRALPASPPTSQAVEDPLVVADHFVALEIVRYNAGGTTTPPATRATYGGVSCAADLARMPATGPTLTPPNGTPHYSFARQRTLTPTTAGRYILRITRTDNVTGGQGDGLFFLQRESGQWKVCGLYPDTQPDPNAPGVAGPDQTTPTTASDPGAGNSNPGQTPSVQDFLTSFTHAVDGG